MKNIFKVLKKRRMESLTNKFINGLRKNGLKLDPSCSDINIWIYDGKDVEIEHTGNREVSQNYGEFKLYKGIDENE